MNNTGYSDYFRALEKRGEWIQGTFIHHRDGKSPEFHYLSHAEADGLSGLIHLVKSRGTLSEKQLPRIPLRGTPPFWTSLREYVRFVKELPYHPADWIPKDPSSSLRPVSVGYDFFSKEETSRLISHAKKAQVPVHVYLLFQLNEASFPWRKDPSETSIWMTPVLTTSEITLDMPLGNYISFLDLFLEPGMTLSDLSDQFLKKMSAGAHWGTAFALRLNRLFGAKGMTKMIEAIESRGRRTGIFSNVGVWSPDPSSEAWTGIPPVTRALPFGAGVVTWGGRAGLALQFHPSLHGDPSEASRLLLDWKSLLLSGADL